MKLFLQTKTGADGQAMLGAMVDLGLDADALGNVLAASGLPCSLTVRRTMKKGEPGTAVSIRAGAAEAMNFRAAETLFRNAPVADSVRLGAIGSLNLLRSACRGESLPPETPAILLGVSWGASELGAGGCAAGLLPWSVSGRGMEPGAAEILCGREVLLSRDDACVSAAGAALWAALFAPADQEPAPVLVKAKGVGFGFPSSARAEMFLLEEKGGCPQRDGGDEDILQLETHIDHLTGEEIGCAIEVLSHMPGVLDAAWFSGIGKKNRPVGLLRVLCYPRDEARVGAALFRHTHTLGYRRALLKRTVLPRHGGKAVLDSGKEVAAKYYDVDGATYVRPESDALRKAAEEAGLGLPAMRFAGGGSGKKGS